MSGFCFDASEHIARIYTRADVSEIDKFLAKTDRCQFKLHDIEDFTNVTENAEGIVNEYISRRIVARETRYFCPKHKNTALERPKRLCPNRKRICPKCEKSYSVECLATETIFIRKKEPDRPLPSEATTTGEANGRPEKRWYKDPKWITERIGIPVFLILATFIIRDALSDSPVTVDPLESSPATAQIEPAYTPTNTATPTLKATQAYTPTVDLTPTA